MARGPARVIRFARPYARQPLADGQPYGPDDAFLAISQGARDTPKGHTRLLSSQVDGQRHSLILLPYPPRGHSDMPVVRGLPPKPKAGGETKTDADTFAHATLWRMNQVLARVQELEEALDDPEHLWPRLRTAWDAATEDANPRMAEIVRQARDMGACLDDLEVRLRKILRRDHARVALDRVNEMDRRSMQWLARQPGRTVAERAGGDQRIMAIVRNENYDTLENRVLHAYVLLADAAAREWMLEHAAAEASARYGVVRQYRGKCRLLTNALAQLGIGIASPGIVPNYVLQDDRSYRSVHFAWLRLLRQSAQEDELWSWQAETWTDFCILAVTLAIEGLDDSELVAQSPIQWKSEMREGRWFAQDNPLAVFWLRDAGLVVEIQARPDRVSTRQFFTKAFVWLRLTNLASGQQRRVPVWTPHMMHRADPAEEAEAACRILDHVRRVPQQDLHEMYDGLILLPAQGSADKSTVRVGDRSVTAIAIDPAGPGLKSGRVAIGGFVRQAVLVGER